MENCCKSGVVLVLGWEFWSCRISRWWYFEVVYCNRWDCNWRCEVLDFDFFGCGERGRWELWYLFRCIRVVVGYCLWICLRMIFVFCFCCCFYILLFLLFFCIYGLSLCCLLFLFFWFLLFWLEDRVMDLLDNYMMVGVYILLFVYFFVFCVCYCLVIFFFF